MMYRLIKRRAVAELDCASDLIARQYAMADRAIVEVQTEAGRVVYRKVDLSKLEKEDDNE